MSTPSAGMPVYDFRVLFLDYDKKHAPNLIAEGINLEFETDGEVFRIAARSDRLSRFFQYAGKPSLVFFCENEKSDGVVVRTPLVEADMGLAGEKLVVVMRNAKGKLSAVALDTNEQSFQPGTIRVMNLSSHPVMVKLGADVVKVGSMRRQDITPTFEGRQSMQRLALAVTDGDERYLIENRRLVFKRDDRRLLLTRPAFDDAGRVDYTLVSVGDMPPTVANVSDEPLQKIDLQESIDALSFEPTYSQPE